MNGLLSALEKSDSGQEQSTLQARLTVAQFRLEQAKREQTRAENRVRNSESALKRSQASQRKAQGELKRAQRHKSETTAKVEAELSGVNSAEQSLRFGRRRLEAAREGVDANSGAVEKAREVESQAEQQLAAASPESG